MCTYMGGGSNGVRDRSLVIGKGGVQNGSML